MQKTCVGQLVGQTVASEELPVIEPIESRAAKIASFFIESQAHVGKKRRRISTSQSRLFLRDPARWASARLSSLPSPVAFRQRDGIQVRTIGLGRVAGANLIISQLNYRGITLRRSGLARIVRLGRGGPQRTLPIRERHFENSPR